MGKIRLDNLADEVEKMLDEYADEVADNVKEATHKVALLTVRALQQESKAAANPGKGKNAYYRGWRTWSETTRLSQKETIYNDYLPSVPHLLEYGHALRNGGRTQPRIHIEPVANEAERLMRQELEARLK